MNSTQSKKQKSSSPLHSGFWLDGWNRDKSFLNGLTHLERESHDTYKLASAKRSIANFVTIVTGQSIPVEFNEKGQSYTDGKSVVIGANIVEPRDFDVAVGLALHEGSHIKLSNFDTLRNISQLIPQSVINKAVTKGINNTISVVKDLWNVVEDRRIDEYIYGSAPGYREYYHSMYDKYFNSPVIDKGLISTSYTDETVESYMFRIINIHNRHTDLTKLKGLKEISELIDLKNISRLENTHDTFEVALNVFKVILKQIDLAQQNQQNEQNEQNEQGDGNGGDGKPQEPKELSDSEFDKLMKDLDDQLENGDDGDGEESDGQGSPSDGQGGKMGKSKGNGTPIKLTPKQQEILDKKIQKQRDFMEKGVEKEEISSDQNQNVKSIEESGTEMKPVGQENGTVQGVECIVVKRLTSTLLNSNMFPMTSTYGGVARKQYENEVNRGIQIGTILGKKLQVRSESRTTVFNRQKIGRIDKRMIASLGFGNENVFQFNDVDTFNNANLHISIDASGSMGGRKWTQTMVNVVAMCKACDMISGLDIQVTFRTTQDDKPYIVMAYNSKVDKFSKVKQMFPCLDANGTTPEGLCYEAIMNEFLSSSGNLDSYFINLSDGEPYFSGSNFYYGGHTAAKHTQKQFKKIQNMGIKTLSYYVESGSNGNINSLFKTMYGSSARSIDVTNVSEITKTVNKLFMSKKQ